MRILVSVVHSLGNPLALLRHHVRGGKDLPCRIDQEKDENLAVTRFGGIVQAEWLDLVLVQVRERDASVGFGDHIANTLHARGVPNTQVLQFIGLGAQTPGSAPIHIIKHSHAHSVIVAVGLWFGGGSPE